LRACCDIKSLKLAPIRKGYGITCPHAETAFDIKPAIIIVILILIIRLTIKNKNSRHQIYHFRLQARMTSSSNSPPSIFEEFCQLILNLDESIRFVGIATLSGAILASKYRANLIPLLTKEETASFIEDSLWRMKSRRDVEGKIGKTLYVIATYEKVKRATIPVGQEGQSILIISFDSKSDPESIIRNKVLTIIKPYGTIGH